MELEQATCKCVNPDCSQSGVEKSALIAMMYGYGRARTLIICPECQNLLVINRSGGSDSHLN